MKFINSSPDSNESETSGTLSVDSSIVRDLIPKLMNNGAEGIIEYPLNKVV